MKTHEEIFHLYLKGERVSPDEIIINKDYARDKINESKALIKKIKDVDLLDYSSGKDLLSACNTLVALLEMSVDYMETPWE